MSCWGKDEMLSSLGLGGDGDEVNAIGDVEREFGVNLDKSDASSWGSLCFTS